MACLNKALASFFCYIMESSKHFGVKTMFQSLLKIANELNQHNIHWALGGSMMLLYHGLAEDAHDIDLMVTVDDFLIASSVLLSLGIKLKKRVEISPLYQTENFAEYKIDGYDVDLMAGLQISHKNGIYRYCFDELSVTDSKWHDGVKINYASLEDWYVLYLLMPHRSIKVQKIEHHLIKIQIKHPLLLERALRGNLPEPVKNRVEGILYQTHPEYKVI